MPAFQSYKHVYRIWWHLEVWLQMERPSSHPRLYSCHYKHEKYNKVFLGCQLFFFSLGLVLKYLNKVTEGTQKYKLLSKDTTTKRFLSSFKTKHLLISLLTQFFGGQKYNILKFFCCAILTQFIHGNNPWHLAAFGYFFFYKSFKMLLIWNGWCVCFSEQILQQQDWWDRS